VGSPMLRRAMSSRVNPRPPEGDLLEHSAISLLRMPSDQEISRNLWLDGHGCDP
jgi:hypothetical protein